MALTMTCRNCGGEVEYDVERADSGDGPWAQSYWVGAVLYEEVADGEGGSWCRTACGCQWTDREVAELDEMATERAAESSGSEP